jgi:hypothetical protein
MLLETSFKYEPNHTILVTYNSYFVVQIVNQRSTSKFVLALYFGTEGIHVILILTRAYFHEKIQLHVVYAKMEKSK